MKSVLRHRINTVFITLLVCLIAMQCDGNRQEPINKYFNIQEFIDKQVAVLQAQDAQLVKALKIDGKSESQSITRLDSVQWEKEFKIVREHDINKPVLVDAYSIEETVTEDGRKHIVYILIDSSQSGILNMKISIDARGMVTSWKSIFSEENILYSNLREISMSFLPNRELMSGYAIHGYHKLMFSDTVYYQLQSVINYEN